MNSHDHVAVGPVTGVGLAEGRRNVQFAVLGNIFVNWIVTLPAAGVVSALIFLTLRTLFLE